MRRLTTLLGLMLVTVMLAAACVGSNADAPADRAVAEETEAQPDAVTGLADPATAPEGDVAAQATDEAGDGTAPVPALEPVFDGRSIIFTATVSLAVEDVTAATIQAQTAVESIGGVLYGQESSGGEQPRSTITFKVPPEGFSAAVARLADVGEIVSQTVTTDDVTERVVDLESQIRTAETSVDRLRDLLADAGNIENIATLESQLLDRETRLEQLRGQLRTLEARVDLATIVVTLTQADLVSSGISVAATAATGHGLGDVCRGREGIQLDNGTDVTLCYAVTNTGVTELTDVTVIDDELGLTTDDLRLVSGDPDELAAGETVVFSHETVVDGDLTSQVGASALTAKGEEVGAVDTVEVSALGDDALPGFGDALDASLGALVTVGGFLVILAGVLLPFLLVLAPVVLAVRWYTRSRRSTTLPPPPDPDPADAEAATADEAEPAPRP